MIKRIKKILIMLVTVLVTGFIYYILSIHDISLPCVFFEVTGLYCPGCGATRMFTSLFRLDFYGAFRSNQVSFFVLPLIAVIFARKLYFYIRYGQAKNEKWMTVFATVSIVVLLVFGVVRNIPYFEFLRPL